MGTAASGAGATRGRGLGPTAHPGQRAHPEPGKRPGGEIRVWGPAVEYFRRMVVTGFAAVSAALVAPGAGEIKYLYSCFTTSLNSALRPAT